MNEKIDNLVNYFIGLFCENESKGTNFSRMVNKKTLDMKEDDFKKQLIKFSTDSNDNMWVNPVDILIMAINSFEKIRKEINIKNSNRFTILWIICLLSAKCMASHDHESKLSIEFLSNLGGFQLEDYVYFEKTLLKKLDWKLDISEQNYNRLYEIAINSYLINLN